MQQRLNYLNTHFIATEVWEVNILTSGRHEHWSNTEIYEAFRSRRTQRATLRPHVQRDISIFLAVLRRTLGGAPPVTLNTPPASRHGLGHAAIWPRPENSVNPLERGLRGRCEIGSR